MNSFPALSLLTALPAAGAVLILLIARRQRAARMMALIVSLLALFFVHILWHHFDSSSAAYQFQELHPWIPTLNVDYHLGIDGIGLIMLLAAAIVTPIGIAASWRDERVARRTPLYFALVLLLESCIFGSFTALNFFHFFLYWELSLIPAFFLIRLWGGPRRASASTQFFVYTMVGSVAMLLSFLAIFLATHTWDFAQLSTLAQSGQLMPAVTAELAWARFTPHHLALLLFLGAFLGFAVKTPVIPFHTWLPDAYAEAPTGTTILLTGAMSKMGIYGFLRILVPMFGTEMHALLKPLLVLAVASIVLSAYSALAQKDLKRIFAYSSINHLGYCLLAIFALVAANPDPTQRYAALSGALLQTLNHALTAAAVFWFIALLEQRTGGLRSLTDFGGLRRIAPVFAGLMGIALFSSLGLPGLNGFPGEFLIFKGAFPLAPRTSSIATLGLLLTAIFILTVIQRVFTGPLNPQRASFPDLTRGERLALAPAIALMFVLGLYPQLILAAVNPTVVSYVHHLVF
ncbi:MAG TPA: NADH-quinone oxidoreductase subunit M [Acidobacteriaceae bacterium]|nr:NADH-quinone oxidoreductase subunit M [Acidobacteriaceae bacterium]